MNYGLIQKPFEHYCEGARYFTRKHGYQIGTLTKERGMLIGGNGLVHTDAETINFFGNWDNNGIFIGDGSGNKDYDLVMYVWSSLE